jgi:hypothetical protein
MSGRLPRATDHGKGSRSFQHQHDQATCVTEAAVKELLQPLGKGAKVTCLSHFKYHRLTVLKSGS